jgi:uncharacterized protein with von Willebrand factor type A (vWA) domain
MAEAAAAADPLAAIAGFAQLLRAHGLAVGVAEQAAMVQAALALPPQRHAALNAAWRAIACQRRRDWRQWPDLFARYWQPQRQRGSTRVSGQTRPSRDLRQLVQQMHAQMNAAAGQRPGSAPGAADAALDAATPAADDPGLAQAQGGASRSDPLHDRSLAQWLPQDLAQLQRLAERIADQLRRRLTRRWAADAQARRRLDLRRTLRRSLATGGEPIAPCWQQPRRQRPRLFVLVDVSRSMSVHAQLFLRIARAFVGAAQARVFVFHTRLAEVTPLLQRDSGTVQEKVNAVAAGFGGGTRIASSLRDFTDVHARSQLGRGARVWVLSDGYDADPPAELAPALQRITARGARITWFHPGPQQPVSSAMTDAAPLVHRFVRLNTLRDLADAAPLLR